MKKICVYDSHIHGKGLMASEKIERGELIGYIKGPVMYRENQTLRETFSNPDWVGFKKNYWTDPEPPFKFLNHSCQANSGVRGTRSVYAVRRIKAGEEITIDYSTTELDERWFLDCKCGAPKCRHTIRSIQSLPKPVFDRYDPFIPTYNRNYYLTYCV